MSVKTEDEWEAEFGGSVESPEGSMMWPMYGEMCEQMKRDIDPQRIWSALEGENDSIYLAPGFHVVNLIGYVVSEKPLDPERSHEWEEVLWFDGRDLERAPGA